MLVVVAVMVAISISVVIFIELSIAISMVVSGGIAITMGSPGRALALGGGFIHGNRQERNLGRVSINYRLFEMRPLSGYFLGGRENPWNKAQEREIRFLLLSTTN